MFQSKKPSLKIKVINISGTDNSNNNNNNDNNNNNNDDSSKKGIKKEEPKKFSLTDSGTFKEGDLAINRKGLLIAGESPKNSPSNYVDRRRAPPRQSNLGSSSQNNNSNSSSSNNNISKNNNNNNTNVNNDSMGDLFNLLSFELNELRILRVLGVGAGGVVKLAKHVKTDLKLALKIINLDVQENARKQIILELKTLHKTHSNNVVKFYDAFFSDNSIHIVLEYMDAGTLTDLLKRVRAIPEAIIAKISFEILSGLHYLHRSLHVIHRDIKPSNILINRQGQVKIADFGVSSQRHDTLSQAVTWVGTVVYMSPERISGKSYSYDSDVWSLGLTMLECALGRFPYSDENSNNEEAKALPANTEGAPLVNFGFWTLMDKIVKNPAPLPPSDKFSPEFCSFISDCLQKEPEERPSATTLLKHPFILKYQNDNTSLLEYFSSSIPEETPLDE